MSDDFFDERLRSAVAPLAAEPLPDGVLELGPSEHGGRHQLRWALGAGAGIAAVAVWIIFLQTGPLPVADASPTATASAPAPSPSASQAEPTAIVSPTASPEPTATPFPIPSAPEGLTGTIAYVANGDDDPQIFLLDLASGESRQLTDIAPQDVQLTGLQSAMSPAISCFGGPSGLSWSPDGSLLAFHYSLGCSESVLFTVELDGTLHRIGDGHSQSWAPDGSRLVFAPNIPYSPCGIGCLDPSLGPWELLVADPLGANPPVALAGTPANMAPMVPHWSPDGTLIAFAAISPDPDPSDVWATSAYIVNADGSNMRRVADGGHPQGWTPDGRLLFYDGTDDETVLVDVETGAREPLGSGSAEEVALSPAGDRLLQERYDSVADAYSVDVLTFPERALLVTIDGSSPTWDPTGAWFLTTERPTGDRVTFHSAEGSVLGTYTIDFSIFDLAWQPQVP